MQKNVKILIFDLNDLGVELLVDDSMCYLIKLAQINKILEK
jgi:hypothetical protein